MDENNLKSGAKAEVERLCRAQNIIEKVLAEAPKGCLEISHHKGKSYYRQKIADEGGVHRRYLATEIPEQRKILKELATKGCYKKLELTIKKEKNVLSDFVEKYRPEEKYKIYDEMPEDRKKFVEKFLYSPAEMVRVTQARKTAALRKQFDGWAAQPEYANSYRTGDRVIETRDGHVVRSKSERMIADELSAHNERLAYKYEAALNLSGKNYSCEAGLSAGECNNYEPYSNYSNKICYPDFIIFDKENGRQYVWEHFGMMDTPAYANKEFIAKLEAYEGAGFRLGERLFATFESSEHPLQLFQVKCVLEQILSKN